MKIGSLLTVNHWSYGHGTNGLPCVNDLRYNVIDEGFRIDNEYHVKDFHVKPTNSCRQTVPPFFETGSMGATNSAWGPKSETL